MAKVEKAVVVSDSGEPLGKLAMTLDLHLDLLPKGSDVIKSVNESESHVKHENVHGIHEGKRPKFVSHPKE